VQLMVYVGGTMVLLIFGVMLTARGPFVSMKIGSGQWVVAIVIGGALLAVLLQTAFNFSVPAPGSPPQESSQAAEMKPSATEQLGFSLLGAPVDRPQQPDHVLGGYLLAFEIISIHLVVVLVGAAYLARAKRRVQRQAAQPDASPY
jgi:NADH-quinone oxidoreductase subunit J